MSHATNCNTHIRYNNKVITLPHSSEKLHKSFDNYFEREYNLRKYGYDFIEKEVLSDQNGEYLLYDSDDDRFVINTIAYRDLDRGWPEYVRKYFNVDWVERIDIKREKNPRVTTLLDLFKNVTLDRKYEILKSLDVYLGYVTRYVEN